MAHPLRIAETGRWEGIFLATARSEHTTSYYGPSSMQYFLSRVGTFVGNAFEDPVPTRNMLLTGAHRRLAHPTSRETALQASATTSSTAQHPSGSSTLPAMTRTQEEYFLNNFWESYYCAFPIVDEDAFRLHYNSLWEVDASRGQGQRKDSALVDMILALCIQSSSAFLPQAVSAAALAAGEDPTIAGRWHYRRGRALITSDMESPSATTVQVLLLAVIYLCCASFQNTAHATLALAVRDATIAGLHREPPANLPQAERELRKRIWWTLWTVDTKMCLKLGRPFDVDPACESFVSFPSDAPEVASNSVLYEPVMCRGSSVTWLTYGTHVRAIVSTAANIHRSVFARYDELLAAHNPPLSTPYRHPEILEQCAQILSSSVGPLHDLADQVPKELRLPRGPGSSSEPFSFDGSTIRLEENIPVWLQNQRVYLELTYHSMAINLYRPFISFYRRGAGAGALHRYLPATDRHAARAARHAITFIRIVHRVVRDTTLLAPSWNEYFQWLWNATVTLIGFLFAHPLHATTAAARDAADLAVSVCDIYAASRFTVAADASSILRCFLKRLDELSARVAGVPTESAGAIASNSTTPTVGSISGETLLADAQGDGGIDMVSSDMAIDDPTLSWLDPQQPGNPDSLNLFMDWALGVDSFNNFDQLLGPSMEWDASRW